MPKRGRDEYEKTQVEIDEETKEAPRVPYWSAVIAARSKAIYQINSGDREEHDDSFSRKAKNSWFSAKLVKSSTAPLAMGPLSSFPAKKRKPAKRKKTKTADKGPLRGVMICLKPTPEQRKIAIRWSGIYRTVYNRAIEGLHQNVPPVANHLRAYATCDDKELWKQNESTKKWHGPNDLVLDVCPPSYDEKKLSILDACPKQVWDEAIRDVEKAFNAAMALSKVTGKSFKLGFKSKKDKRQGFYIPKRAWKETFRRGPLKVQSKLMFSPSSWETTRTRHEGKKPQQLPDELPCEGRMVIERGKFILRYSQPFKPDPTPAKPYSAVAIDPGVRTFATTYSPQRAEVSEWGAGDMSKLFKLCHKADRLRSRMSNKTLNHHKRQRMKWGFRATYVRLKNLVADMHWKFATVLVDRYSEILLPIFETQGMVSKRAGRKIRSKTARGMLTWSHYTFRQRLLWKAQHRTDVKVILCTEEYTSKTCTSCGQLHTNLGSNKIFSCPSCGFTADRDVNAARGIYLKNEGLLAGP